jgi:CheY-like chemotaxis protein
MPDRRYILVVDDNRDFADGLAELLRYTLSIDVDVVYNGAEAVTRAMESRPVAVVVDIAMPGLDGVTAADCLREAFRPDPPRLVAITGNVERLRDSGAADTTFDLTLPKPVELEELLDFLRPLC